MFTLTIDEVVNGFVVRAYESKEPGYLLNEFHEERLDALKVIERLFRDEIIKELERRTSNASTM